MTDAEIIKALYERPHPMLMSYETVFYAYQVIVDLEPFFDLPPYAARIVYVHPMGEQRH